MKLAGSWLCLGALLSFGCGTAPEREHRELQSAVVGGMPSGSEDDAVVSVRDDSGICSGALVAPNLVVTALHCVAAFDSSNTGFTCDAAGRLINNGNGHGEIGPASEPANIRIYAGQKPEDEPVAFGSRVLTTNSTQICANDLAFVVLDRKLDHLPILPIRLSSVRTGELVTVVGYGMTADGDPGRHRREGVRVTSVGTPPRTFTVGPGPCTGDSGGPAISESTNAVLGVYSLLHGSCTSTLVNNVYTNLSSFDDLALRAFAAAEANPWYEGEGGPLPYESPGSAGAAGASGAASGGAAGAAGANHGAGGSDAVEPGDDESDEGCNVSRGPSTGGNVLPTLLGAAALVLVGRRRRSR